MARNVGDPLEWGTEDMLAGALEHFIRSDQNPNDERLERTWDSPYIAEFKDKWVREHSQLIHEAADRYNLPPELVAGVIWQEAGVLPGIVDTAIYQARNWLPIDIDPESPLNDIPVIGRIFGSPEETSFGEIQMQIRTAAELLGYENPENLSEAQEKEIIAKLEDPASSIDLAARYLAQLRENTSENFLDLDNQPETMTDEEFVAVATQYNRGDLTLEQVNQKPDYGESILNLRDNTESLLE
ncbi:hypothetical protein [Trichocoleus sp. ST-U2]|uniref:hypothetical protein n=1 Tax=Trichocoleus sp. ST-U2 TaxID=2933929 RepID=UPI003299A7F1